MLPFRKSTLTSQHNIKLYDVGINELLPVGLKIHIHISETYIYQKISISQFRPGLSFGHKISCLATYIEKNCFIKINVEADEMANVKKTFVSIRKKHSIQFSIYIQLNYVLKYLLLIHPYVSRSDHSLQSHV